MDKFTNLYNLYKNQIYKYLYYLSGNSHIAEELLQETFIRVYKSVGSFKGQSKISTWIYGIARNVYLTNYSKEKKQEDKLERYKNLQLDKVHKNPVDEVEDKEAVKGIINIINLMEEPYRQVIILRVFNKLSFKEIGEVMERRETWARTIFHRGKVKLKGRIKDERNKL